MDDFNRPSSSAVPPSAALRPGSTRPVTSHRPTIPRVGTATRLAAAASAVAPPGNILPGQRVGSAFVGARIITDRPITQHGLSGLTGGRLATATGSRQVKDKRYWQGVIHMKVQEITQETSRLMTDKKSRERDRSAQKIYERKIKESAKELAALQSQLAEMNIALDGYTSGQSRQQMQNETLAHKERNETVQVQLEKLFVERQARDHQNASLEQEIERERNKVNEMVHHLSADDQVKYRELRDLSEQLKLRNIELQNQIAGAAKQKERMNGILSTSQLRVDAVRLNLLYEELLDKKNAYAEEQKNKLTPAQEREKLISEVRTNNQAMASLNRQIKIVEDQLAEKRETLSHIEQDLEEGNSDRHMKYKELKKRDETMSAFLESFPQQMTTEKMNIDQLKHKITYAIEQMTLQGMKLKNVDTEKNDLSSQNGLLKEYKKLSIQLKQLQLLEKRNSVQLEQLKSEERSLMDEIQKYSQLEMLRSDKGDQMTLLTEQLSELRHKKTVTEGVVEEAARRTKEIKDQLRTNESYKKLAHLEDKLDELKGQLKEASEQVEAIKRDYDYETTKASAEETLGQIMEVLRGP